MTFRCQVGDPGEGFIQKDGPTEWIGEKVSLGLPTFFFEMNEY